MAQTEEYQPEPTYEEQEASPEAEFDQVGYDLMGHMFNANLLADLDWAGEKYVGKKKGPAREITDAKLRNWIIGGLPAYGSESLKLYSSEYARLVQEFGQLSQGFREEEMHKWLQRLYTDLDATRYLVSPDLRVTAGTILDAEVVSEVLYYVESVDRELIPNRLESVVGLVGNYLRSVIRLINEAGRPSSVPEAPEIRPAESMTDEEIYHQLRAVQDILNNLMAELKRRNLSNPQ